MILDKDTIQTHKNYFDYLNLNEDLIDIEDIAHSLSLICRFGGHIKQFYSVAAHSCFVADMMERDGYFNLSLLGLMHDAHEAYVTDVTRPVKRFMKEHYNFDFNKTFAEPIDKLIFKKYGLPFPITEGFESQIKKYDNIALFTEKTYLFENDMEWGWKEEVQDKEFFFNYIDPKKDYKQEFLNRFEKYSK